MISPKSAQTRITFLCSGAGGNLRLLHALCEARALESASVTSVISDRECPALDWARSRSLEAFALDYARARPAGLHSALREIDPDIVVTTIHKILDAELVSRYAGRMLNLHYSLLPAFAGSIGMETVRLARQRKCRIVGATAHLVTDAVDGGPILAQAAVVDDGIMAQTRLFDAVFRAGGVALAAAAQQMLNPDSVATGGCFDAAGISMIASPLPGHPARTALGSEAFWQRLR